MDVSRLAGQLFVIGDLLCLFQHSSINREGLSIPGNVMAPQLSPLICPGTEYSTSTSLNQLCIHIIFCVHWDIDTYSASTVESATLVCLLLLQVTSPLAIRNTYPEVD
jgi:hypothetical protein